MKQKILAFLLAIMVVVSFLPSFITPQDVYASATTLNPSKDTYIRSGAAENINYGTATHIDVGVFPYSSGCGGEYERGLVEFEAPWDSLIPAGSIIQSAWLQLYYYDSSGEDPAGQVVYAQRLKRTGLDPWLETHATWRKYIGNTGYWVSPGAAGIGWDYTEIDQAHATVPPIDAWMTWMVLEQVTTAQSSDLDIAFRLYMPSEASCGCYGADCHEARFYSRDYADSNYWPRLVINYLPPSAPISGTINAYNVTYDSATCYGRVIDTGSADVTTRGFKYGLTESDTFDIHANGTFGVGDYSFNLTNLEPNTTYRFRAYATNTYGTAYGSWKSFSTGTGLPIVTTGSVYIYGYGCGELSMSGIIVDEGLSYVSKRGFEWSLFSPDPTYAYDTYEYGSFGVGNYSLTDTLPSSGQCWFRAYAVNSYGTGYGVWKPFYGGEGLDSTCPVPVEEPPEGCIAIHDVDELQAMSNNLSGSYYLADDIDCFEYPFTSVGNLSNPFVGEFYGLGYRISQLVINSPGDNYVGLFGYADSAEIYNVVLEIEATGYDYAGGLVGYSDNVDATCCAVSGNITGHNYVGMVAGYIGASGGATYQYCRASGSITGNNYIGGFVGFEHNTYICDSFADVDVIANSGTEAVHQRVGGFVGYFNAGIIRRCFATGDVTGTHNSVYRTNVGGFVGHAYYYDIYDCYARGAVIANNDYSGGIYAYAGGFAGQLQTPVGGSSDLYHCYATGSVAATGSYDGGLCGYGGVGLGDHVSDCFWDIQTSGNTDSTVGTGKYTTEMKMQSTFTNWDFATVWAIDDTYGMVNDGYPYFDWALTAPPEEATKYTLSLSSNTGGNVTIPGEGDFDYEYGTLASLNTTADSGYRFALWVGDVSEVTDTHNATTTVTMIDNFSIMAIFVPEGRYALYLDSTAGGNVTDPGEGLFTYGYNDVVDIEATSDGDYAFVMWTGDTDDVDDETAATTTVTMLDDYAITANFVTSWLYALIISSTEGGEVLDPGEGLFEYAPSTVVNLTAQPNPGAWFVEWTGDVGAISDVYDAATNITMSSNYSIIAEFGMPGSFDLTIISSVGGNVTDPGEGTFTYDAGTVVDLLAEADEGYEFFAWTGDTGTVDDAVNEDTTITMNGDYVIVANFEATEECSLLLGLAATEGGNVTAPGEGVFTFPCGSLITITAEPYSGWWFSEWTGDIETVTNPLSFNTTVQMLDDYSITANFVEEEAPPVGAPNVTTLAATDIMSSSAWLNGELVSLGNYTQGYVFLQYGTTTSYGTNTREQLRTATGNFSAWVGNLATNTTYHFRAVCRYGSYVYGADGNFTTLEGETCADCLWAGIQPYESLLTGDDDLAMVYGANWYGQTFTVETESHSAVDLRFLVYRVGLPSTITVSIRECGDDGMPTGEDLTSGTFDGDSVTNSTGGSWYGTTLTETGLACDETYAILVRAEAGDESNYLAMRIDTGNGYSGGQAITSGSGGIIWTADVGNDAMFQVYGRALIRVYEAKVFTSYLEDNDVLIVLSYLNTYVPYYPDEIASLHFLLQLRSSNGDTILSQTVCQQWGYMPGSIYLNANQAASLTNGWPYRIYLAGTSAEKPVACYILQPDDWLGDAVDLLCPWAIATANSMATYYGTAMTAQVQNKEVLNSEGGTLFAAGIPSMVITDPECFQDISYIPDTDTITPGPTEFDSSTTWEIQVGPVVARLANGVGGVFGDISGKYIIAAIFFVLYLIMCYFVVRAKADPIIATFLFVPILLGVADLRVLDFQLVAALGAVAVIMTVYRYHWSRT